MGSVQDHIGVASTLTVDILLEAVVRRGRPHGKEAEKTVLLGLKQIDAENRKAGHSTQYETECRKKIKVRRYTMNAKEYVAHSGINYDVIIPVRGGQVDWGDFSENSAPGPQHFDGEFVLYLAKTGKCYPVKDLPVVEEVQWARNKAGVTAALVGEKFFHAHLSIYQVGKWGNAPKGFLLAEEIPDFGPIVHLRDCGHEEDYEGGGSRSCYHTTSQRDFLGASSCPCCLNGSEGMMNPWNFYPDDED